MRLTFSSKRTRKVIFAIFETIMIASVVFLILFIAKSYGMEHDDSSLAISRLVAIEDGWRRAYPDGHTEKITFPYSCDGRAEEVVILEGHLPENLEDKDWISFRAMKQDVRVYIDGELRSSATQGDYLPYRKDVVSRYLFTDVSSEDAGAAIRIEAVRHVDGSRSFEIPYCGLKYDITVNYLGQNLFPLICVVIYLVLGMICVVFGVYVRLSTNNVVQVDYMGWAMIFIACWDLTQSEFRDLFFTNVKAISILPSVSLALFPIAISLYFNKLQKFRYEMLYMISIIFDIVSIVVRMILQKLHICDFYQGVTVSFVEIYFVFLILIFSILKDKKLGYMREYKTIIYGFYVMAVMGLLQVINFFTTTRSTDGSYFCIGFGALTIMSFIHALKSVMNMEGQSKAAVIASDLKSQFLANMSHEIRTPINAVLGMNEAIIRETDQEVVRQYAADVDNAGRLLLSLINDILDFSKLEAGKMNILSNDYKLKDLILSCYQLAMDKALKKGIEFEVEVEEQLPSVLKGDEIRIRQILTNLLSNAFKYTEKGKVKLTIREYNKRTLLGTVRDNEEIDDKITLYFIVSDTGIGIKPGDMTRLFNSFQRVEENRNRNIEGTGLGLAITSELVSLMGGDIDVSSTYGVGSSFIVKLPQMIVDETCVGKVNFNEYHCESDKSVFKDLFTAPDARILVVDDVTANLVVVKSLLKSTKLQIDTATSGDKALELTRQKEYHVILLDHMMPGKDGIETLKEMRADKDNKNLFTPVIMLSANAMVGAKEGYIEEGFTDYLSKPITARELEEKLMRYLPPQHLVITGEKSMEIENIAANEAVGEKKNSMIDMEVALEFCGGEKEIVLAVAGAFLDDDKRQELEGYLQAGDMENYTIAVHGVKSASKSIGGTLVSEKAFELEMLSKDGRLQEVKEKHPAFIELYGRLLDEIKDMLKG